MVEKDIQQTEAILDTAHLQKVFPMLSSNSVCKELSRLLQKSKERSKRVLRLPT